MSECLRLGCDPSQKGATRDKTNGKAALPASAGWRPIGLPGRNNEERSPHKMLRGIAAKYFNKIHPNPTEIEKSFVERALDYAEADLKSRWRTKSDVNTQQF